MYPVYLLLYLSNLLFTTTGQLDEPQDWFRFTKLVQEHEENCPGCQEGGERNACCGYCSCDADCEIYGSCCLGYFSSLSHAADSLASSVLECVKPQYTLKGSKYNARETLWMITKCKPSATDDVIVDMCNNPGDDASVDHVVPVTDLSSMIHYRNIFCGYCNGVGNSAPLVRWQPQIHNDHYLRISDGSLLQKLRQQSGNIIFKPPAFVQVRMCTVPPYRISKCNVTGEWSLYDEDVERACVSFVDPFNSTYKNYFCYKCNSPAPYRTPTNLACTDTYSSEESIPPFFVILDVPPAVLEATGEQLFCNSTQFPDLKKMVCRNIGCHKPYLDQGRCGQLLETCYSMFLKLTWLPSSLPLLLTHMDNIERKSKIKDALAERIPDFDKIVSELQVFGTANAQYVMVHLVLYLLIHIPPELDGFRHDYVDHLMLLDGSTISLQFVFGRKAEFQIKIGLYNITYHYDLKVVLVPNETTFYVDVIRYLFSHSDGRSGCTGKELVLTKLRVCPFVDFYINETVLHFENDLLIIDEGSSNNENKIVFSKSLYDVNDQNIRICLDDYVTVYNNMAPWQEYTLGTAAQIFPSLDGYSPFLFATASQLFVLCIT